MRHVAVIGAGPSGLYLVDQLLRAAPDVEVDILERLPTPLGLVRSGVAPDHQSTKGVARLLDRVLCRERVRFWGNVVVGVDVSLAALLDSYDAVVLATGASVDRRLGIPGEDLPVVYGSGKFVGWYNNHPDRTGLRPPSARHAVIIGAGNVAIDVARLLAKRGEELVGSDLAPDVEAHLAAQPIESITIVARGAAAAARFTPLELAELGELHHARTAVFDPDGIAGEGPMVDVLRDLNRADRPPAPIALNLMFGLTPKAVVDEAGGHVLRVADREGVSQDLPADLIVTCIGYQTADVCSQPATGGVFKNDDGLVADRLYAVGWCKRGPSGTIPTNRTEAATVAQRIAAETIDGGRDGSAALRGLLAAKGAQVVDYAAWRRIDEQEQARAGPQRVRHKYAEINDMILAAAPQSAVEPSA
jgi:ferredoxin--NADP+ reductase